MHTGGATIAFFSVWFLMNIGFFFIGLHLIRNSKKATDLFVILAPIFVGVGVWGMVSSLANAR